MLKLYKNKNFRLFSEKTQRPIAARYDVTAKKVVSGLFRNL